MNINWAELILGAISGLLATRIWKTISKPKIAFKISQEASFSLNNSTAKLLQIDVLNLKRSLIERFLFGDISLQNARVWIEFFDFESNVNILSIDGRWSTKKEPVNYNTKQVDIAEAMIVNRELIPVGESSTVPVALKELGSIECFAFNNTSYIHNLKNPEYELAEKRYKIRIRIASEGNEWCEDFNLLNPGKTHRFFKISK